jgi:hypothetical protein
METLNTSLFLILYGLIFPPLVVLVGIKTFKQMARKTYKRACSFSFRSGKTD